MGETLNTLPWFYTYILARARAVRAVQDACARARVVAPDPSEVSYWDAPAVSQYIQAQGRENDAFEQQAPQFSYGG